MPFPLLGAVAGSAIGGLASWATGGNAQRNALAAGAGGLLGAGAQYGLGGAIRRSGAGAAVGGTVKGRSMGFLLVEKGGQTLLVKTARRRRSRRVVYVQAQARRRN